MTVFGPGPFFALSAAALWAVSPMFMASAGRRIGSFPVVLLRSLLASVLLAVVIGVMALQSGKWPALPDARQAAWLAVSGLLGMGIGDVLIYEAFVSLGPRRTTQTLVLAPAVAVVIGWLALGEVLSGTTLLGVMIILGATSYAVLAGQRRPVQRGFSTLPAGLPDARPGSEALSPAPVLAGGESGDVESIQEETPGKTTRGDEPGHVTATGILCAIGGAICMAAGAVTGRQAFAGATVPMDTYMATFVRVGVAGGFLWLAPLVRRKIPETLALLRDPHVLSRICVGTLLGPFIGMSCYVAALKTTPAGLVSTLVATSPLFAIPVTIIRYRTRIGWDIWLAAVMAVAGASVLFFG
ncbi:DMT family transporter [Humisphaera borealis]|uniref:DMT family transporter n=1 Tax=Humisphaera borealis TaxID=2807512 RepID=A0A7M2WR76_9BACT|nr:DMT family transporter [Humisphaera borealis]QOV87976.1 DMT family transporter [Humisphaera borealis]